MRSVSYVSSVVVALRSVMLCAQRVFEAVCIIVEHVGFMKLSEIPEMMVNMVLSDRLDGVDIRSER